MLKVRSHIVVCLLVRPHTTVALATTHTIFLPIPLRRFCPDVERGINAYNFPLTTTQELTFVSLDHLCLSVTQVQFLTMHFLVQMGMVGGPSPLGCTDSVYDERRHCRHSVTPVTAVTLVTAS